MNYWKVVFLWPVFLVVATYRALREFHEWDVPAKFAVLSCERSL